MLKFIIFVTIVILCLIIYSWWKMNKARKDKKYKEHSFYKKLFILFLSILVIFFIGYGVYIIYFGNKKVSNKGLLKQLFSQFQKQNNTTKEQEWIEKNCDEYILNTTSSETSDQYFDMKKKMGRDSAIILCKNKVNVDINT